MKRALLTIAFLLIGSTSYADHFSQLPDFRGAYDEERIVVIPAGETVAMPSGDIDLLWIEGTCVAPRNADLDLKVSEIIVAPGALLDMGTEADPVLGKVTITFADGDFTADDPTQWGHGLIVAGDITCWGFPTPAWEEIGNDPLTVQMNSQNVVFQSENPDGTRGHTLYTDQADVSIGNTAFIGLGRTKPERLSVSNLIGRYPVHFHHSMGANRSLHNVVVDGLDYKSKWGIVVHASSWIDVTDCVATRTGGAGFVTEGGSEVGNRFSHCLATDNRKVAVVDFKTSVIEGLGGSGFWCKSIANFYDDCVMTDNHIGFQSAGNLPRTTTQSSPENIAQQSYQISPGGPLTGKIDKYQSTLSGERNQFINNHLAGFDAWGSKCTSWDADTDSDLIVDFFRLATIPTHWKDCTFAYNGTQSLHSLTETAALYETCEFIGNGGGVGINTSGNYRRVYYCDGCTFDGLKIGAVTGTGNIYRDCVFNTDVGIRFDHQAANGWPFGVSLVDNIYLGEPTEIVRTDQTLADIPPHQQTMDDVYFDIYAWRDRILDPSGSTPDPDEEERQRLMAEIAAVQKQIAILSATLADLQSQLDNL